MCANTPISSLNISADPHSCAIEMEHEAFKATKMANLYKALILRKVSKKKKALLMHFML